MHTVVHTMPMMATHPIDRSPSLETVIRDPKPMAVVKALHHGILPPTINLENPDEGFNLDFVANEAQERQVECALNNSFGFGGHNVSIVFGRA